MQSLLLPVTHVVLGPAERAYWRLAEPLWERVGLEPPAILPRPSVFVLPAGAFVDVEALEPIRLGRWEVFQGAGGGLPSDLEPLDPSPAWGGAVGARYAAEWARFRRRLSGLDRRVHRDQAASRLGMDPERLRQALFPFGRAQERVLPGLLWLRHPALLDAMEAALGRPDAVHLIPDPGSRP